MEGRGQDTEDSKGVWEGGWSPRRVLSLIHPGKGNAHKTVTHAVQSQRRWFKRTEFGSQMLCHYNIITSVLSLRFSVMRQGTFSPTPHFSSGLGAFPGA